MAEDAKKTAPADEKPKLSASKEPSKDAPAEKAAAEPKPGKKFSTVMLAVIGLVCFVLFLGVFSYMMGVFNQKPPVDAQKIAGDTEKTVPAGETGKADSTASPVTQYVSEYGRAAAAVEAAQKGGVDTIAAISDLEQRRKEIAVEESKLQTEQQELATLKGQVEELLSQKKAIAGEKVLYMAKLLDGMKQEELAGLMAKLDDRTILAVLPNMKPINASKVLAMLPPERAAQIATQLLGPE